jgi:hypothetical protein
VHIAVLIFPDLAALGRAQDPRPVEVGYREGGGHGCSASLAKEGRSHNRCPRVNRSLMPARRLKRELPAPAVKARTDM